LNSSSADPPPQGNLLLDRILGADIRFISSPDDRQSTMEEIAADLRDAGNVPYIIPGGGSNGVGAVGYVAAMLELNHQLWEQNIHPSAMYFAAGGGGTHGGIALGGALYGSDYLIVGVMIEDTAVDGVERASSIADAAADRLRVPNPLTPLDIVCDDNHVGPGYGIPTPECLDAIRLLARSEGVLLDPVYTAKAFAGMVSDIRAGRYQSDESVVFLHTGGAPALFAMTDILGPVIA
jgi:1-aminocyclopropane-1-carboxylate deaminase/D-cysteine desulfhydrase-like pyridoxal-dependent ACC family enzyme